MIRVNKFHFFLQALAFAGAALLIFFAFRGGAWDEKITALFYGASTPLNPWPYDNYLWVRIAYQGGSVLTAIWGISVIVIFLLGFWSSKLRALRSFCVLSFLVLALGPGLLVNAVFKDHWGRPRPRETIAFGGEKNYQSPFVISDQGGKSFPCGHCSVGFSLCVLAFWSRRVGCKRALYIGGWLAALLVGGYLGAARISVGAHYFSDVLSSAWSVFLVAWLVEAFVPKKAGVESESDAGVNAEKNSGQSIIIRWVAGVAGVTVLALFAFFSLMALPVKKSGTYQLQLPSDVTAAFQVPTSSLEDVHPDLWVSLVSEIEGLVLERENSVRWNGSDPLAVHYEIEGFGYPWSDLDFSLITKDSPSGGRVELTVVIEETGLFRELNGRVFIDSK